MTRRRGRRPAGRSAAGRTRCRPTPARALDQPPSGLTVTIGYGPSLFDKRFGLARHCKPAALHDLPGFMGDDLDPARPGGDPSIQVARTTRSGLHAVRNLIRLGLGTVSVRWSQLGFRRTSSTSHTQKTPRNLFGFRDGTNNLMAEDGAALEESTSGSRRRMPPVPRRGRPVGRIWWRGASGCIEVWDWTNLQEQGGTSSAAASSRASRWARRRSSTRSTSPPGGWTGSQRSRPSACRPSPTPRISTASGSLRRGYPTSPRAPTASHLDAGLFFIAFMRDAHRQFVPMQRALSRPKDALNEYIEHTGRPSSSARPARARPTTGAPNSFG